MYVQGDKDKIVNPETQSYARDLFSRAEAPFSARIIPGQPHAIPTDRGDLVVQYLLDLAVQTPCGQK
jgi:pimeloyl-ACP methyl ester carboxylesterase